ncbi:hypothetical protein B0H15DRAFT_871433 [Mycena belliarum]|uniref:Uncharacterized protein n=1 Tax=Mycena belliarum TaxID=1033014 RepID=A0AAD6TNR7_9AGAR|nr:hypothetical protein B0H15DRAFT_871433 [Mycena belliae]
MRAAVFLLIYVPQLAALRRPRAAHVPTVPAAQRKAPCLQTSTLARSQVRRCCPSRAAPSRPGTAAISCPERPRAPRSTPGLRRGTAAPRRPRCSHLAPHEVRTLSACAPRVYLLILLPQIIRRRLRPRAPSASRLASIPRPRLHEARVRRDSRRAHPSVPPSPTRASGRVSCGTNAGHSAAAAAERGRCARPRRSLDASPRRRRALVRARLYARYAVATPAVCRFPGVGGARHRPRLPPPQARPRSRLALSIYKDPKRVFDAACNGALRPAVAVPPSPSARPGPRFRPRTPAPRPSPMRRTPQPATWSASGHVGLKNPVPSKLGMACQRAVRCPARSRRGRAAASGDNPRLCRVVRQFARADLRMCGPARAADREAPETCGPPECAESPAARAREVGAAISSAVSGDPPLWGVQIRAGRVRARPSGGSGGARPSSNAPNGLAPPAATTSS